MHIHHETPFGVFEWDSEKNAVNILKHKLDFVDAVEVFLDEHAVLRHDARHSQAEERYNIVGTVRGVRIAAVVFTDRDKVTRIISARKATKAEVLDYERHFKNRLEGV